MSNSEIAHKSSTSNSANTSITSENLSNEANFMWSLTYDVETNTSADSNELPQYSWRKKHAESKCIDSDSQRNTPSPTAMDKDAINSMDLLKSKYNILRQIALEHSILVGLMRDEVNLTGIEPEDYAESVKAYEKAVDDFEFFQIFMDSLVITGSQETDLNPESEKRRLHRETSYALSSGMLQKLTYGSLQNIVRAQEMERKGGIDLIDLTGESVPPIQDQTQNRASSIPRELFPPTIPRSATISAGSASIASKARLLTVKETPPPAPALRRFFSLKSLSDSLSMLNSKHFSGPFHQSINVDDGAGFVGTISSLPTQSRRSVTRMDPKTLEELITWNDVEIATLQNILKVNLDKAKDSVICKKSRKAYKYSAEDNQKKLLRLYQENEKLKEARQSALALRSQSVGRFEKSSSNDDVIYASPSTLPPPVESYATTHNNHRINHRPSIEGDAISDTFIFHADEQSDSSNSSAKKVDSSSLTISCQSSGSNQTNNSSSSRGKDISLDIPFENSSSSINNVQPLFSFQKQQQGMRSYGRPNYSRHGSVYFEKANRPEELNRLPRFYPAQDSRLNPIYGYSGHQPSQFFQSNPHHRLVQYTNFTVTNYFPQSPTLTSPTHLYPNTTNLLKGVQVLSESERLTSPPAGQQITSPEITPTPSEPRTRFTLADKLNMCTLNPTTTTTSFH